MPDIFRHWSPNDPLNGLPADFMNLLVEMGKDYLRKRNATSPVKIAIPTETNVGVKNVSGQTLQQYSIVRCATPAVQPSVRPNAEEPYCYGNVVFETAAPAEGESFAVLQKPCPEDGVVDARVSGDTMARINLGNADHRYAAPSVSYNTLTSQAAVGPALLYKLFLPSSTQLDGAIDASQTTVTVDSSAGYPEPNFVVTIGTEKLLVTAVSGVTWTVTRGHGGTTAASHADNLAVAFTSGIVWAIVILDQGGQPSVLDRTCSGADITLESVTCVGIGSMPNRHGSGTITLDSVTCAGSGALSAARSGSGTITLESVTCAGIGVFTQMTFVGTGSITLESVTCAGAGKSALPGPFVAKLTAAGLHVFSSPWVWVYDWIEQQPDANSDFTDKAGGLSGDVLDGPWMRELNDGYTDTPVFVHAQLRGTDSSGVLVYDFERCCTDVPPDDASGTGSITLSAVTCVGSGVFIALKSGSGDITLESVTCFGLGASTLDRSGSGSIELEKVQCIGAGALVKLGTGDITLETVICAGSGTFSGGGGGVMVDCCEEEIPETLFLTLNGSGCCVAGVTSFELIYDAGGINGAGWYSDELICGETTLQWFFACELVDDLPQFVIYQKCDGTTTPRGTGILTSCSPFLWTGPWAQSLTCCTLNNTIITITE